MSATTVQNIKYKNTYTVKNEVATNLGWEKKHWETLGKTCAFSPRGRQDNVLPRDTPRKRRLFYTRCMRRRFVDRRFYNHPTLWESGSITKLFRFPYSLQRVFQTKKLLCLQCHYNIFLNILLKDLSKHKIGIIKLQYTPTYKQYII